MTRDDLEELGEDLYREYLLDHYKNPRNAGVLEPADIDFEGDNPACGDRIRVTARLDDAGRITDIKFQGTGCAISQASASILYEEVIGKATDDVLQLDRAKIEELTGITLRPSRVKCGVLGLHSLKHGIHALRGAPARDQKSLPGFKTRGNDSA